MEHGQAAATEAGAAREVGRILVVDDDPFIRDLFERHLGRLGHLVMAAESAESALAMLREAEVDIVLSDIRMSGLSGLDLLDRVRSAWPDVEVIVITAAPDMDSAVRAMKAGAFDYLTKPLDLDEVALVVERCLADLARRRRLTRLTRTVAEPYALDRMVAKSPRMLEVFKRVGALARTTAPVLLRGETGTGKERIARAIHFNSPNAAEPFIAVNCAAVPEALLESELFGHVRGAFTGATADRKGRFELAGAGTLFLDEIGDTTPGFQAKLLRVLQEGEFYPVGGERLRRTAARIIAATNRPLEAMVRDGTFREDLYFRLSVVELALPPLRERREDIPDLAEHFLRAAAERFDKPISPLPPDTLRALLAYDWPGNVRELEHTITRAVVLSRGATITPEDLGIELPPGAPPGTPPGAAQGAQPAAPADTATHPDADAEPDLSLEAAQERHIRAVLARTGGNKRAAARLLRISRSRLDRLLAKYDPPAP